MERQQLEAAVVDLDVQLVDRLVAGEHALDRDVALDEPLDGAAHPFFGQPAHLEQPRLELVELFLEVATDAFHGNLTWQTGRGRVFRGGPPPTH